MTLRAGALRDSPPRDSLWPEVARRIGHAEAAPGDELARRRGRSRLPLRWAAGMAAVLALGIGIGRKLPDGPGALPPARTAAATPQTDPYRVAAVEHLARSQALLTSFQHTSADAQTEALVSHWANDLLSNTRLLLDSPAANDARVRRLLQDLELVLVQIAQLRGQGPRAEVDLARDAITESGVLPRMRAVVVPAAAPSSTGET